MRKPPSTSSIYPDRRVDLRILNEEVVCISIYPRDLIHGTQVSTSSTSPLGFTSRHCRNWEKPLQICSFFWVKRTDFLAAQFMTPLQCNLESKLGAFKKHLQYHTWKDSFRNPSMLVGWDIQQPHTYVQIYKSVFQKYSPIPILLGIFGRLYTPAPVYA